MRKTALIVSAIALALIIVAGVVAWQRYIIKQPIQGKKVFQVGLLQMAPVVSVNMDGFRAGMDELGYRDGENVIYTYRDAQGDLDKLKVYAKELTDMKPDMIFVNTSPATLAIKDATQGTGIPVVFSMVADPLSAGLVASSQSSGNNLTGTSCAYIEIASKRIEVLTEVAPKAKKVLVFYRPEDKSGGACTDKIVVKGKELGLEIIPFKISKKEDIEEKLKTLVPGEVDAVMDPGDSMVSSAVDTIIKYTNNLKIPYMALSKGEVDKGAVVGYAVDYADLGKQTSLIANQVLAGIKPTDIPFEQPRRWYFSLNLKTAKDNGLEIPQNVIEKADYVVR
ncbi:MAG: ABC transporter substrate-binding protein [Candidatus Moraniibacteriota bacterium]